MPLDFKNWKTVPGQQDHPTSQSQSGHLNSKIHPHSAQELKDHIKEGTERTNGILLQRVLQKFKDRLRTCISSMEALLNMLF
jgi:hypothetical protein